MKDNNIGQSRKHSAVESCCNIFSGMLVAFVISQLAHELQPLIREYIWSKFEWELSVGSNIIMTVILTFISVIRSYLWRRTFNNFQTSKHNSANENVYVEVGRNL